MIMKNVLAAAMPYLEGRTIKDLVVGVTLIGCQLDNGFLGVSYVLRDELPAGCSFFPHGREIIGKPAAEIAGWVISGGNDLQRGVGSAVLTAASRGLDLPADSKAGKPFGVDCKPTDTIGMIGLITPVVKQLSTLVEKIIVFDKSIQQNPLVSPMDKQAELLPQCDVVFISGTATVNGTIDSLLAMCSKAREIIMVGPSTPMFPEGWKNSGVTVLAGSWWEDEKKEEIFQVISLAGGIKQLNRYMLKKTVAVNG